MADANILQGAIFHDDLEAPDRLEVTENDNSDVLPRNVRNSSKPLQVKPKQPKDVAKPAVHRVQFLDYYTYIYMYIYPPTRHRVLLAWMEDIFFYGDSFCTLALEDDFCCHKIL